MKRSLTYSLYTAAALSMGSMGWSTPIETETDVTDAISKIAPSYERLAADPVILSDVQGPIDGQLDMAQRGVPVAVANSDSYWSLTSNTLYAVASLNNTWKTFSVGSLPSSWSATTTLTLPETVRDGASGPGTPYSLALILTKAGAVADLTQAALKAFLEKSPTKTFAASNAGTALAGVPALPAGWTAKAYVADGASAAVAASLDPIGITLNMPVTPTVGSAITFSATLANLHTWNLATNSTTTRKATFVTAAGHLIKFDVLPGPFLRTTGSSIVAGLITALTASPKRLNHTQPSFCNSLPSAVAKLLAIFNTSAPNNLLEGFNTLAASLIGSASFAIGDFTAKADTNKMGLVALTAANITSVTWETEGTKLIANGKIGSGALKDFTCDLVGKTVVKAGTNEVLTFTAPDGDAFFVKCVDATGYDTSANADVAAADQDEMLALVLRGKLASVTTINNLKLIPMSTAALA